jgi:hypothetical protein
LVSYSHCRVLFVFLSYSTCLVLGFLYWNLILIVLSWLSAFSWQCRSKIEELRKNYRKTWR